MLGISRKLGRRVILWDEALEFASLLPPASDGGEGGEGAGGEGEGGEGGGGGGGGGGGDHGVVMDVWRDWLRTHYELRDQALLAGHEVICAPPLR